MAYLAFDGELDGDEPTPTGKRFVAFDGDLDPESRTWGQAAADTAVQLGEGVNTILGAVPNLVAPEGDMAAFFNRNAQYWRDQQSDPLKSKIASADQAITAAGEDGVMSQVAEAASQYFSDPALAARFVTTNLPSMIPGIGAAKVAQAAALARGATAAKAVAAATTAAGATNAALNAGGARGEAFEDIKNTLIQQGVPEEQATDQALKDSRVVAAIGAATGYFSGKTGLEKAITSGATKGGIRTGLVSAATELAGEQVEEVAPKLATNVQASQYDNRSIGKDVGRTIVETAIASGPGAVVSGGMAARKLEDIGKASSVDEAIATASEALDATPSELSDTPDTEVEPPQVWRRGEAKQEAGPVLDPRIDVPRTRDLVQEPSGSFGAVEEFADLVSEERADVQQRRAGLIESAIADQIADIDAQVAYNREQQSQQNRMAVMDQVLGSEAAVSMPPAQLVQAFTQALTAQGYANAAPTAQETARIERAAMARDAMLESEQPIIEPSAPNELDAAALIPERQPKQAAVEPLARVKTLLSQGYTLQGKQLQGPAGEKINLSRNELLYVKAQRKGASNDGNTTADPVRLPDGRAGSPEGTTPVLGYPAAGREAVPQPGIAGQADPAPAVAAGGSGVSVTDRAADRQPALTGKASKDAERNARRTAKLADMEQMPTRQLREIAGKRGNPVWMKSAAGDILQTRAASAKMKQSAAQRKLYAKSNRIDPEKDSMAAAIARMGGVSAASAQSRLRLAPEELKTLGSGIRRVFTGNGRSMDEMAEAMANLGYVDVDENGKADLRDFEDKLAQVAGGEEVLTPAGIMRRAQEEYEAAQKEVGAQSPEDYAEIEDWADAIEQDADPAAVQAMLAAYEADKENDPGDFSIENDLTAYDDPADDVLPTLMTDEEIDRYAESIESEETGLGTEDDTGGQAPRGAEGTRPAPADAGAGQDFALTGESKDEGTARLEAEMAAQKREIAELRQQMEQDRAAREQKEINARQQASAENFQLGQSAEDSLSGQQDLLGNVNTDTEAFRRWFGDSKVVNADGKPLVVYHGTDADFSEFDPDKIGSATDDGHLGKGFYFSTDPRVIGKRAVGMPVYLRAENPLIVSMPDFKTDKRNLVPKDLGDHDAVILDYSPTGYAHKEIMVRSPEQIKSATGNNGKFNPKDPSILGKASTPSLAAAFDQSLYDDIGAGKSATDILTRIAAESDNALNREIAQALLDAGINPKVTQETAEGKRFTVGNAPQGYAFAAAYSPKTDTVMLFRAEEAERNVLHEAVHAGSFKAIRKGGMNSLRMKELYAHVKKSGKAGDAYGMSNLDEFTAEALSNPEFQNVLRSITKMPEGSKFANAWDWFVDMVRRALGLPTKNADALDQALRYGRGLMTENQDQASADGEVLGNVARNVSGTWMAPATNKMDDIIFTMQDKQIDTRRVVEAIGDAVGRIDDKWNPYLQEELFHGRSAKKVKDFLGNELKPLLQDMQLRGIDMADFEDYLQNRHAEERNKQIAKVNPKMPDGGSGIDTADARAYLAKLPANKKKAFEDLAKRVDAINKATRKLLVAAGLETQETVDAWESAYQHYVPLQREESGAGIGQGFSVRGSSSKRAMGSKKDVISILSNIAMQRERAIVRAEKNRVAQALYGLSITQPNTEFWLPVNPDNPGPNVQQELVDIGLNPVDAKNLIDEPTQQYIDPRTGLVAERVNPFLRSARNVLSVRVGGKDRYIFFNESDERAMRMVATLKNLDADQLGRVLSLSAKVTRYFSAINTQFNPIFGAINLIRDVQGAMLNLTTTELRGKQKEVMAHTVSALRGIYIDLRDHRAGRKPSSAWAAEFEEFQNEGGQTGYRDMFSNSQERADALKRELSAMSEGKAKATARAVFDWLSDYNETMENAVRLAAYKVAKEKGMTKQQAASLAKNLTVNFNRKGQIATQAGAMYAFFNASVQGTTRLAKTLRGPTGKKIIMGGLVLGSVQALALAAAGFGEDEPPDFVKDRNVIIPLPDGKYLTVPMPLGFNIIPAISRITTEFALSGFKNPTKHLAHLIDQFADIFNPIGNAGFSLQTITPTAIDPLAALSENRDWTGKPIAKKDMNSMSPTPGHTRAKDTASEISKTLSYWINLASGGTKYKPGMISPTPDQLDYLIGQATGGVGREALKVEQTITSTMTGEELPPNKVPFFGRFYGDTKGQSGVSAKYYDNLTALNLHENEIKGRRKDKGDVMGYLRDNPEARLVQFANEVDRDVQNLKRRKRELLEKEAGPERIKLIEQQITARMKRFNDRVEKLRSQPVEQ